MLTNQAHAFNRDVPGILASLDKQEKLEALEYLLNSRHPDDGPLPLSHIEEFIENNYCDLEEWLLANSGLFFSKQLIWNNNNHVEQFKGQLAKAALSVIHELLKQSSKRIRLKEFGHGYRIFFEARCLFANAKLQVKTSGGTLIRYIDPAAIQVINWPTNAAKLQKLYHVVEGCRIRFSRLHDTFSKLISVKNMEKAVFNEIEDYGDIFNLDGIVSKQVKRFDELLTTSEKLGIKFVDDEIARIYADFIDRIQNKTQLLKSERNLHDQRVLSKPTVTQKVLTCRKREIASGVTQRFVAIGEDVTSLIAIPPKELADNERHDQSRYLAVPYFYSEDPARVVEPIEFVLTQWHLSLLKDLLPLLFNNQNINTLLMGLAGTGKDYFIAYLAALLNLELCSFDCRHLFDIQDFFYTRRIENMSDRYVTTQAYKALTTEGCLLNLAEFNKLGPKASDLNSLFDHKRRVFMPVEGRYYTLPPGNLVFGSTNPAWFGGGRAAIEFDVKDRFAYILRYDYPPFFPAPVKNRKLLRTADSDDPLYFSHEAEIRYRLLEPLAKLSQLEFRNFWYHTFHQQYNTKDEQSLFYKGDTRYRALIALKNILHFTNRYRSGFQLFRTGKTDVMASEMVSQRVVQMMVLRLALIDPGMDHYSSYKKAITGVMKNRFEDPEQGMSVLFEFLKS